MPPKVKSEIKQSLSKINSLHNQLIRFNDWLSRVTSASQHIDSATCNELEVRIKQTETLFSKFEDLHSFLIAQEDQSLDIPDIQDFEDLFFAVIGKAKDTLRQHDLSNQSKSVSSVPQITQIPNNNNSSIEQLQVRLPIIDLPTFDGSYSNWETYKDTFVSLIHDNKNLTDIQKFHYLKSTLKNGALQLLDNLKATNNNYKTGWDLLVERFENKKLIINDHIKALFEIPVVHKESMSQLLDIYNILKKHLRALENLGQPTSQWDTLIIHLVTTKLDNQTKRAYTEFTKRINLPTIDDLYAFLKERANMLEQLDSNKSNISVKPENKQLLLRPKRESYGVHAATLNNQICPSCKANHYLFQCEKFKSLAVNARFNFVKELKLCKNCLNPNHNTSECKSNNTCRQCKKKHHTLIHFENTNFNNISKPTDNNDTNAIETSVNSHSLESRSQTLLSTACVLISDLQGNRHLCKVLLDSGSQSNFITQELCKTLKLNPTKTNHSIFGINSSLSKISSKVDVQIQSRHSSYTMDLSCLVLPKITERMPINSFDNHSLNIPSNIQLADDTFNKSSKIDMLIGADSFWNLLCIGHIKLGINKPVLHKTKLGWIVSGRLIMSNASSNNGNSSSCISCAYFSNECDNKLEDQISTFWHIEEPTNFVTQLTPEELECEKHFEQTILKDKEGKFIVSMPLKANHEQLGNSRQKCLNRFYQLERKLQSVLKIKQEYADFMQEYLDLNHMVEIAEENEQAPDTYYLPHHAVMKHTSLTTKLRVVFDGSAQTDTGLSLNDIQLLGPVLQSDLFSIILRFRKHNVTLTGDIMKMYRQIWIHPDQRKLQRIFWRNEPSEQLKCYELQTVTYGTKSAPYLATKCVYYQAEQYKNEYPRTCKIIQEDTYVDDVLTGGETIEEVLQIYREMTFILSTAGFNLRKFLSNSSEILNNIGENNSLDHNIIDLGPNETVKTLGVVWNASLDLIQYTINLNQEKRVTKRSILSAISQLFDPLGLLGPVIITAKIIIQELWKLKIEWDEPVPNHIYLTWSKFISEFPALEKIQVSRHVLCESPKEIELHGFSDACATSYGACIYLRSVDHLNNVKVSLLCAKSKVAPLKPSTIPRLELLGALMLARLYDKVIHSMQLDFTKVMFWCDSTIVLAWINTEPHLLKTFVNNRIADIQNLTQKQDWHHVSTNSNPADIISRGLSPSNLVNSKLWWEGPLWLSQPNYDVPIQPISHTDTFKYQSLETLEIDKSSQNILCNISHDQGTSTDINAQSDDLFINNIFNKFSSINKLQRVVAYCVRFKTNCLNSYHKSLGPLKTQEIQAAILLLVKLAQYQSFSTEIKTLQKNKSLNSKSSLLCLNPFLDEQGILRVGGRIQHSKFDYHKKFPILLPSRHPFTNLIMTSEHKRLLHCGAHTLLASVRERYWPIGGKNLAKGIIRNCVICFRTNPHVMKHIMGDLPKFRITINPPFFNVGVDYAGPILLREKKIRNTKLVKAYICLFICLGTKAIHLELVSSLSSEAFMATLRRFISRRGKPKNIYSDNGTNFVGVNNELLELYKFLQKTDIQNFLTSSLSEDFISWHFIPPKSPHLAGIWEAGVKSAKQHLKRVVGNASLTFEECSTVLTQIEAVLNSRPLTSISTDPNDLTALTPAHFLIGRSLVALPEHDLMEVPVNRLSRYQKLQQLVQHFWMRWSMEYISSLQSRSNWKQKYPNLIKEGSLVLVKDKISPPQKWPLARVTELHPGSDGVVRVVTLKLPNQVTKRAIKTLCVLPTS